MNTLELLNRKPITYELAKDEDTNIISEHAHVRATREFYQQLWSQKTIMVAIVKHHLRLSSTDLCTVTPPREWIRGSFNVCILITLRTASFSGQVMLRCPLPYKLAEAQYPGTIDEKMCCEIGAYAWMEENCPTIRIPHLHGFGFSNHIQFTHVRHLPLHIRLFHNIRRHLLMLFRFSNLSYFSSDRSTNCLSSAYMLLEYIEPKVGTMLSRTWETYRNDAARRQHLFQGIAKLILSLARIPQPRIGSIRFDYDGSIVLANRPLTCTTIIKENDGALRTIQRSDTYSCTEPFVADMLTFHDNHFLSNLNAVADESDCRDQMAGKTVLRALSHQYISKQYRHGPFILQFTDFHASNIFVDDDWNVKCLIDLEWICALPVENLAVPYWLSGCSIDQIEGENYEEFDAIRKEFMAAFEAEEQQTMMHHNLPLSHIMKESWISHRVWFWYCIISVNAMLSLVRVHLCPKFAVRLSTKAEEILSKFWCEGAEEVVHRKVADHAQYDEELKSLFQ